MLYGLQPYNFDAYTESSRNEILEKVFQPSSLFGFHALAIPRAIDVRNLIVCGGTS